jgi:hypothetical protein
MKLPNLVRTSVIAALPLTVMWLVAHAQISGTGTTGVTAGSGRGIGSAGVMTGTGPDVRPLNAEQPNGVVAQQNISTTTTTRSDYASSAKKESRSTRKHSRRSQSTPTPSASASPR